MSNWITNNTFVDDLSPHDLNTWAFERNFDPMLLTAVLDVLIDSATVADLDAIFIAPTSSMLDAIASSIPISPELFCQVPWGMSTLAEQLEMHGL